MLLETFFGYYSGNFFSYFFGNPFGNSFENYLREIPKFWVFQIFICEFVRLHQWTFNQYLPMNLFPQFPLKWIQQFPSFEIPSTTPPAIANVFGISFGNYLIIHCSVGTYCHSKIRAGYSRFQHFSVPILVRPLGNDFTFAPN